ncbi:dUTP diphosphatase [Bacteroides stercoris]|jgi:dUTP pyrophosphatase|uniref:Deoxyuridine 5'-triphosphate nucleotidohydrolase n=1 Tax=Bacteroides stercoris TaxID=46506 RepID=A0A120A0N8_BACSE|nr:dUTP diphosphatase [Bacteroides stercoris]DAN58343.1 MAG TPA: dUTPase [Caudoviricetes sp.]KWR52349.1 deoxyuridine 5'-triphosphate nucleotidohydrolase [Bacteroides stercoris]MDC2283168.1 dUTP diphosphatase [Bacteroides stercoris]MDC2296822.1 dUTP diphosphatase [Bacteroides stercoris]MDC2299925.1 dUTP diphosphatase [Bacteroides stercoris]
MKIKIYSTSKHPLPQYATQQSAGLDLRANIDSSVTINPGERVLVPTGLHIQLPYGYEARIQPRSGLALKKGITCLNSPGCVDADYRGEIGIILINHGTEPFTVNDGERVAQMVISKYEQAEWNPVSSIEDLEATERGTQGFGHTGTE